MHRTLLKTYTATFVLACSGAPAYAQTIEGLVTSGKQLPVLNAVVSICKTTDSTVIIAGSTDKEGRYSIAYNTTSDFLVKAEAKGYITEWKKPEPDKHKLNFALQSDHALAEAVVVARKPVVEYKADRTVFHIENSVAADAGDAYMALKKTPGVQVMQSQIMVQGKGGVSVMLNGRLQQLSGEDLVQFLRSIPSASLSKVEVITAPGAKMDAEGGNAIINIVTKKNLKAGLQGSATLACTRNKYFSPSGSMSLQYRQGKLNLFSNNSYSQWNWLYTGITSVFFDDQRIHQTNNTEYRTFNARLHLGGDYALTDKSTIGFSYSKGFGGSESDEDVRAVTYRGNWIADSVSQTNGHTNDKYMGRHTANLNYEWRIDSTGKKLNMDADYFTQGTDRNRNFRIADYQGDETALKRTSENKIDAYFSVDIRSLKADLELPYSFAKISLGAKASFVHNEGSFQYLTKAADDFITDPRRGNKFLFDEQIQAGYLSAMKKLGKFNLQAGIRVERTFNKGYTPATDEVFTRDYTEAFPSIGIQYSLGNDQSLVFNYNRRIARPGYNLLNPFRLYLSETSFMQGNTGLQPSFNEAFDLTWFINRQYFIRVRANHNQNYWDRLYFTDSAAGTTTLTRANLGNAVYYSINFNFMKSLTKWWDVQGFIGGECAWFRVNAYGAERFYSSLNGWGDLSNTFYLNKAKTLMAELHCYYYTPRQKDYKRWEEMSVVDGGFKAMFLDRNLIVSFFFEDPFKKAYWDQKNAVNGTEEFSYDNAFLGNLSITYKFGKHNFKAKRDRSEANEEIQRAR